MTRYPWSLRHAVIHATHTHMLSFMPSTHPHPRKPPTHSQTHTHTRTIQCMYMCKQIVFLTVKISVFSESVLAAEDNASAAFALSALSPALGGVVRRTWVQKPKCTQDTREARIIHPRCSLQHTATHCNTLHHTATHCNTLQHTVTHCNTLHHTATHCDTAKDCNNTQDTRRC